MGETIDMVADDPSEAPAFGGATRVLSENELSGLLAEDARNAPATIAHPATVRRKTASDVSAAVPEQVDDPDPWEHPAAGSVQATPPVQPAARGRRWWLVIALIAVAAAAVWFASGLR